MQVILIAIAVLAALFVQLLHMNQLNRKFVKNGQQFRRDKYWNAERFSILATLVFLTIFFLAFPTAVKKYNLEEFTQIILCALAGGIGVASFSFFLSGSKKYIQDQIKQRLNINNDFAENSQP